MILDNPIYIGQIRYDVHQDWSRRLGKGTNKEPILIPGHHEAIIDEQLWAKVRSLRDAKKSRPSRIFAGEYLLTGLMRCPQCGATMVASRTKNRLKGGQVNVRRYYVCGAFRSKGASVCKSNGVNADKVETHVLNKLREVVLKPKVLKDTSEHQACRASATRSPSPTRRSGRLWCGSITCSARPT